MSWNLKPGDKVVCIRDNVVWDRGLENKLKRGETYTIREVLTTRRGISVYLEEIVNKPIMTEEGMAERCFDIERFRPVRNISIDCFKVHLLQTPSPIKQKENVL